MSQPSLSTQPTQEPVAVSYAELLLGNAEEFGVWTWTGSLCANHHFKLLRLPRGVGSPHCSIKTLQPSQRDISKTTHHAFKYQNRKNHINQINKEWKNSFLWTGPACAFCLLVLLTLFPFFPPNTSPFYKMIVRLLSNFKSIYCNSLKQFIFLLWLCKIDSKV